MSRNQTQQLQNHPWTKYDKILPLNLSAALLTPCNTFYDAFRHPVAIRCSGRLVATMATIATMNQSTQPSSGRPHPPQQEERHGAAAKQQTYLCPQLNSLKCLICLNVSISNFDSRCQHRQFSGGFATASKHCLACARYACVSLHEWDS